MSDTKCSVVCTKCGMIIALNRDDIIKYYNILISLKSKSHANSCGLRRFSHEEISAILNHLNEKTNRTGSAAWKPTTWATVEAINNNVAKQGFSVEDAIKLIDAAVTKFLNTQYAPVLAPTKLFGPKFETYYQNNVGHTPTTKQQKEDAIVYRDGPPA